MIVHIAYVHTNIGNPECSNNNTNIAMSYVKQNNEILKEDTSVI